MSKIRIDHYSDVLCIWAYIAQARMTELQQAFGDRIDIHWRYMPVFGDVYGRLESRWKDKGGAEAHAEHAHRVVEEFPHVTLHESTWRSVIPRSSAPAHLWLCAARLVTAGRGKPSRVEGEFAAAIRQAFFSEGVDVAQADQLRTIAASVGLDMDAIDEQLQSGAAMAELCADTQLARTAQVQASPTLIFNEGRQQLTGNVGYRIIEANIRELLERPTLQHSWC